MTRTDSRWKSWYLLGPVTRFEIGSNLSYEIAQVELEVTRESQSAFHVYRRPDVCMGVLGFDG